MRIRRRATFILCISMMLLALALGAAHAEAEEVHLQIQFGQQDARDMLALINAFRSGNDAWYWNQDDTTKTDLTGSLSPLTYDYELEQVAMQRAAELVVYFEHERPNGQDCFSVYPASLTAMGENIAAGQRTAQAAFVSWQEADEPYMYQGHRRNMLSSRFNVIGIGHAINNNRHYWVQVLGRKRTPDTAATEAETGSRTMTIEISDDRIENRSVVVDPASIALDIGGSCAVPTVRQSFRVNGSWPANVTFSEMMDVEWIIGNANLATMTASQLTALHAGTTHLTSADNLYTVPLSVNYWSIATDATVSMNTVSVPYNGSDQRPEVSATRNGAALILNTDYTVAYRDNTAVGTATVTVSGAGDYSGEAGFTFQITPCGHVWGAPIINREPSYEEPGSQSRICTRCGEVQTETLAVISTPTPVPTAAATPTPGPTPVTEWERTSDDSVTLPQGLKIIGEEAFEGLPAEEVIIPDGVERIEERAFADSDVKHVYLPDSLEHIEDNAFDQVDGLVVDAEPDSYASDWAVAMDYINSPDGNFRYSVDDEGGCTILKYVGTLDKVRIPPAIENRPVTAVADRAFSDCGHVAEVILPETVTRLGEYVFSGCTQLTAYVIPDAITALPEGTFEGCTGLTEYRLPDHVTAIGERAFADCGNLVRFTTHNDLASVGAEAFSGCGKLEYLLLPETVTGIGDDAFEGCDGLRLVVFRGSAAETYVKQNHIPNYRVYDPMFGLYADELLTYRGSDSNLVIPDDLGIAGIHDRAFEGMGMAMGGTFAPVSVTIPEGVLRIGHRAFLDCDGLTTVNLPQSLTSINSQAFEGCGQLLSITIPGNVEYIGDSAFGRCSSMTSLTIRNGVGSIGANAFTGCSKLASVSIPESVTGIGAGAFASCTKLAAVELPETLTAMGSGAFMYCSALTGIEIPAGMKAVPHNSFLGCSSLGSVTLPEGLTTIGMYAFSGCSRLTGIRIPASVTSIGNYAFQNCRSLTTVYGVPGSYAQYWATENGKTFVAVEG